MPTLVRRLGALVMAVAALTACTGSGDSATPSPTTSTSPTGAPGVPQSAADAVVVLLQRGITQAQQGNTAEATNTFTSVLAIDPRNYYALYNLGVIAHGKGDAATATTYYDQALAIEAAYTPAMFNKAILLEASKPDEAIALYEKIVTINPRAATAFLRVSTLYAAKGQGDKAAQARDKALAIDSALSTATPGPTSPPPSPPASPTKGARS